MKTYTQEEVNDILTNESKAKLMREIENFKDDMYNKGFSDGYKKGFADSQNKTNEAISML